MISAIKEIFLTTADFFEYVRHYKDNIEEMDSLDKDLDNLKIRYGEKKRQIEELQKINNIYEKKWDDYLETIKNKNKQIRELKKQNKFLMERENKLQQIETMFENKRVILKELRGLVKGEEK